MRTATVESSPGAAEIGAAPTPTGSSAAGEISAPPAEMGSGPAAEVEPASAAAIAGLLKVAADERLPSGSLVVCTVTGHGLKDPDTALRQWQPPEPIPVDPHAVAAALELA